MAGDEILDALDPEQRAVSTALSGPVCVIAGAGTGKTRAITHRIAHGVVTGAFEARRVLAVTFTTRAAGEMRGRLRALGAEGVQARTFHSAALRQARYFWPQVTGSQLPEIVASKLPAVSAAATRCRVSTDRAVLRDLASEIEWSKVSNVLPDKYLGAAQQARRAVDGVDPEAVGQVYAAYEEIKTERSVMDMEDILLAAVGLLDANPGVAEAVRTQYRHLVVDEFQDVSPLQHRLLELWLGERDEICVVGDPAQTIYSFAGARPDYLLGFPERFPDATVVRLVRDYRSTPQVVGVANTVLANGTDEAARSGVTLKAQRPDGPAPVFTEHADEVEEAESVAREIKALTNGGVPAREIAVLYRVNAQSEAYEQALGELGVPYVVRGAERFFDRPEVRRAGQLLRAAVRSSDSATDGAGVVEAVTAVLSSAGWAPEPPARGGAARERWESLKAVVDMAGEIAATKPDAGVADVVAELEARAAVQHAPVADGVTLASLHAAKGLEWDAVFIAGAHEGTLPLSYADTPAEIAEERRLFYVGVTRARERLTVTWSASRTPGGRGSRQPSRFLHGLAGAPSRSAGQPRRQRAAAPLRCRVCGTVLTVAADRKLGRCAGCPSGVDDAAFEQLFEQLREWRLRSAQQQKVPAFVVFTDATLTAIAEARPVDETSLAAVPGVGKTKLERYGAEVLELCRTRVGAS